LEAASSIPEFGESAVGRTGSPTGNRIAAQLGAEQTQRLTTSLALRRPDSVDSLGRADLPGLVRHLPRISCKRKEDETRAKGGLRAVEDGDMRMVHLVNPYSRSSA